MLYSLENSDIQLKVNPRIARWSVSSRQSNCPSLENIRVSLSYRHGITDCRLLDGWPEYSISDIETIQSPHGSLRQISLTIGSDEKGILCKLIFALATQHPLFLWKMESKNLYRLRVKVLIRPFMPAFFTSIKSNQVFQGRVK